MNKFSIIIFAVVVLIFNVHLFAYQNDNKVPSTDYYSKMGENYLNGIPSDTILKFVKKYGKDSLIHLLNNKIGQSAGYLKSNLSKVQSSLNVVQLYYINKHYKLGLESTLKKEEERANPIISSLYNIDPDKTIINVPDSIEIQRSRHVNIDSFQYNSIPDRDMRSLLVTYGQYFSWDRNTILLLFEMSKFTISLRSELYWEFYELSNKKNITKENQPLFDSLKQRLTIDVKNIVYYKDSVFLRNHTNLAEPIKSLAYGLYTNEFSLKDGGPIVLLLSNQQNDGGWTDDILHLEDNNKPETTLFGLWALCEIRDKCRKL